MKQKETYKNIEKWYTANSHLTFFPVAFGEIYRWHYPF